jgi:hypothetical protein
MRTKSFGGGVAALGLAVVLTYGRRLLRAVTVHEQQLEERFAAVCSEAPTSLKVALE